MKTQTISSSTIKLNLSAGILQNANREATRIGISLQDFIRMLMATYFANADSIRAVSHEQALFDRAQQEIQKGEYVKAKNHRELINYLNSLDT